MRNELRAHWTCVVFWVGTVPPTLVSPKCPTYATKVIITFEYLTLRCLIFLKKWSAFSKLIFINLNTKPLIEYSLFLYILIKNCPWQWKVYHDKWSQRYNARRGLKIYPSELAFYLFFYKNTSHIFCNFMNISSSCSPMELRIELYSAPWVLHLRRVP